MRHWRGTLAPSPPKPRNGAIASGAGSRGAKTGPLSRHDASDALFAAEVHTFLRQNWRDAVTFPKDGLPPTDRSPLRSRRQSRPTRSLEPTGCQRRKVNSPSSCGPMCRHSRFSTVVTSYRMWSASEAARLAEALLGAGMQTMDDRCGAKATSRDHEQDGSNRPI
jgi:hypothetical protein